MLKRPSGSGAALLGCAAAVDLSVATSAGSSVSVEHESSCPISATAIRTRASRSSSIG